MGAEPELVVETSIGSPRKFGTTTAAQPHFIGDPSLVRTLVYNEDICDDKTCGLNTKLGYDIFEKNPTKNALAFSWGDILQGEIMLEATRQPLSHSYLTSKQSSQTQSVTPGYLKSSTPNSSNSHRILPSAPY